MSAEPSQIAQQIETLIAEQLVPRCFLRRVDLAAEVFQTRDPVPYREALAANYTAVGLRWKWGPVWTNAWFRLKGRLPEEGGQWFLRFSCGTEAALWDEGRVVHGLDLNHELAPLPRGAVSGGQIRLYVEAACNRPLGATTFFFDDAAEVERWTQDKPGVLGPCELVEVNQKALEPVHALRFMARVVRLESVGSRSPEPGARLLSRLERLGDSGSPSIDEIVEEARTLFARSAGEPVPAICHAVGHAHIDTAWLWPLRETRRKCLRTFSTALELIDRNPDFNFLATAAQHYEWVEHDSPDLFGRIRARVLAGRWETVGGSGWVEPDCNLPSGESLIRQIVSGVRYFRERFGAAAMQDVLFLPDTFGFPASLPQIAALAGIDTFIFNKLSWNDTNVFPHSTFVWRGIDGTELLSHCTPGQEYNATMTPAELAKGEANQRRTGAGMMNWFQPFGYGDGGGGPTQEMIDRARSAAECTGMPRVRLSRMSEFRAALHAEAAAYQAVVPVWDGELYLERHRGTYTTQAWIKKANRRAEELLRVAELVVFAGPTAPATAQTDQARRHLDEAWKLLLLNQFHDILPGSSIGAVYEESRRQFARIDEIARPMVEKGLKNWAGEVGGGPVVFNPCSCERSGVVEVEGECVWVQDVPAIGVKAISPLPSSPGSAVPQPAEVVDGRTLRNGLISATIDESGAVSDLRPVGGEAVNAGPVNRPMLYDDTPEHWEAWDIDESYLESARPVDGAAESIRVTQSGPLRAAVEVSRRIGFASRITQTYVLDAGSPRLDVITRVDWRERRTLLRALFPTKISAERATYGIQFGHVSRGTGRETPWDRARFEVPAHRWMDLSEGGAGLGLAVLNDCKYGHSCHGSVLGLSLLRGPVFPDPDADIGDHEFTYSLMPHGGDWRAAGVDHEAEALNRPMVVVMGSGGASRPHGPAEWAPFRISFEGDSENPRPRAEIAAVKPSEDGSRLIVRLAETQGLGPARVRVDWRIPAAAVQAVDAMERPLPGDQVKHDAGLRRSEFTIKAFEILTLAVQRG